MTNEEIVAKIQSGKGNEKELLSELYKNNIGYIKKITMHYYSRVNPTEYDDLEQEAFLGLYEAIQKYDFERNIPFMTFASYYCKKYIVRFIRRKSTVLRLPDDQIDSVSHFRQYTLSVRNKEGRIPTDKEYCKYLGISQRRLNMIRDLSNQIKLRSLNEVIIDGRKTFEIMDVIPDTADIESDIIEEEHEREIKEVLWNEVDNLDEKYSFVLRERYRNNKTLLEIGRELGLTQEGARQRESRALSKLKRNLRILNLVKDSDICTSSSKRVGLKFYQNSGSSSVEWAVLKICEQDDKRKHVENQIDNIVDIRMEILRKYLAEQGRCD